tara:strand:- start:1099 stop:1434 length:336 start_codon:yes stop_codon:yes gene_type:complete
MDNKSINGKLIKVLDMQNGTTKAGKEWVKQSFVIDTGSDYNSEICFNLFGQDKVSLISDASVGMEVEVFYNLYSREYKGNYYTSADAWKISVSSNEDNVVTQDEIENDLPF